MTRRILYLPAITLIALTLTLTVIMLISTYRNLHREREQMEKSLVLEATALLRLFEQVIHNTGSRDFREEVSQVQQLAESVAPNDDIVYVYLFNQQGRIIAHTDPRQIGRRVSGDLPRPGEIVKIRNDTPAEHILEVRRVFHPSSPNSSRSHFIALGARMTALEQVHGADHRHNVMMAAILVLLGSASLFFILVVQNFYLVQRTLDRMKSTLHYIVESMANGLVSLDATGQVTMINPVASQLLGLSEFDARDRSYTELFPEHAEAIGEVLAHGKHLLSQEIDYPRPDGTSIPVSLSATQVKDNAGNLLGAVILLQDLREVKALQERARRAEHLASIGRMAATVAHEIRNPLSTIRGLAQYFAKSCPKESEEHTYAITMMEESDRLNRVVSELLEYARPLELNLQKITIERLFEDTHRMVQFDLEAQGVQWHQQIEAGFPPLVVDRDKLVQVLLNLVQNSIAAMPRGGDLTLRAAQREDERVQICVEDTGSGIPEHEIPRIFEPFFTTKTRGTGLGLAIVRKIMDAHGGEVQIASRPEEGTRITLILPLNVEEPEGK